MIILETRHRHEIANDMDFFAGHKGAVYFVSLQKSFR